MENRASVFQIATTYLCSTRDTTGAPSSCNQTDDSLPPLSGLEGDRARDTAAEVGVEVGGKEGVIPTPSGAIGVEGEAGKVAAPAPALAPYPDPVFQEKGFLPKLTCQAWALLASNPALHT